MKAAWNDKANYEQYLRDEAKLQPFSSKLDTTPVLGNAAFDAASTLGTVGGSNALKRISRPRLIETYRRFSDSEMWGTSGLGLSSADGCLRLDLLDLQSPESAVVDTMWKAMHSLPGSTSGSGEHPDGGLHHDTCHSVFGHCQRRAHATLAKKMVKNFNQFFSNGSLPSFGDIFVNAQ